MNYFGKEKEGPPLEFWAWWVEAERGEKDRAALQYNFGAGRAGGDSQAGGARLGHVLWVHTAIEIFLISCRRNVSSRKAEIFFVCFVHHCIPMAGVP